MVLKIPYFKQETLFTCAAAASRMVFAYYGICKSEAELASALNIAPERGVALPELKNLFKKLGLSPIYHPSIENAKNGLEKMMDYLNAGVPVIVPVNRRVYDDKTERMGVEASWEGEGFSYHLIVLTWINNSDVFFNDPHEKIGKHKISRKKFLKAWCDERLTGESLVVRR